MAELSGIKDLDTKRINEEYKIWKKNVCFLYDYILVSSTEWPTLSIDYLPVNEEHHTDYYLENIATSTFTQTQEPECLQLLQTKIPTETSVVMGDKYQDNNKDAGGLGLLAYHDNKPVVTKEISHNGDVNVVRSMPQKPHILATINNSGTVGIYNTTDEADVEPIVLTGHESEGFGLSWSPTTPGILASAGYDKKVLIWNAEEETSPVIQFLGHEKEVQSVSWSSFSENMLASAGDDRTVRFWDTREKTFTANFEAHGEEITSVDFNKHHEHLLATGSKDKTIAVWDSRNMSTKLMSLEFHEGPVTRITWSPFNQCCIASSSTDRRIMIWDISQITQELSPEEAEDGPNTLLFIHAGHTDEIQDFYWSKSEEFLMISAANDNILQCWRMSSAIRPSSRRAEL